MNALEAGTFFSGKTVTISSYDLPTEGYSQYVKLLTRHLGRHIPGAPDFIATNINGGGGLAAINHAAQDPPQDGSFLTMASQALLIYEGTGQKGLARSLKDFQWLGSFTQSNNVTVAWSASGIRSLQDALQRDVRTGAVGAASASLIGPLIYNSVLGTKFTPIYGFDGMSQIVPAMRRGELDSPGNNMWASAKRQMGDELKTGAVVVLLQTGLRKEKDLPDAPLFLDLVRGDSVKEQVATFMSYAVSAARRSRRLRAFPPTGSRYCGGRLTRPCETRHSWRMQQPTISTSIPCPEKTSKRSSPESWTRRWRFEIKSDRFLAWGQIRSARN